jgi:hypothetical protein
VISPGVAEHAMCECADEGAALGLFALMSGLSEEIWCAGWLHGIEYDLWLVAIGKGTDPNDRIRAVTDRQRRLLRLLYDEAGGWWIWKDGPQFVPAEKWLEIVNSKIKGITT